MKGSIGWAKFVVEGKTFSDVRFVKEGQHALDEEFHQELTKDGIFYFLCAVSFSDGYGNSSTKFVFIEWIGSGIKPIMKSKATVIKPSVYKFVDDHMKLSADFQESQPDRLDMEAVLEKLTGSRVGLKSVDVKDASKQHKGLGKEKSELTYEDLPSIHSAMEKLVQQDQTGGVNFLMCSYKPGTTDVLQLKHVGTGGIDEMRTLCHSDSVSWFVYKLKHAKSYQKDFEHLYKWYYGLFQWSGSKLSLLEKALSSHLWNKFANDVNHKMNELDCYIQGSQYFADSLDDVNDERIRGSLKLYD